MKSWPRTLTHAAPADQASPISVQGRSPSRPLWPARQGSGAQTSPGDRHCPARLSAAVASAGQLELL